MDLISRSEAKRLGLKKYYTGKPCVNGHTAERYLYECTCVECKLANWKRWAANNPKDYARQRKQNYDRHKEAYAERGRRWRVENPEKCAQRDEVRNRRKKE